MFCQYKQNIFKLAVLTEKILNWMVYVDAFQSGFKVCFGTEIALITLLGHLSQGLNEGNVSLVLSTLVSFKVGWPDQCLDTMLCNGSISS